MSVRFSKQKTEDGVSSNLAPAARFCIEQYPPNCNPPHSMHLCICDERASTCPISRLYAQVPCHSSSPNRWYHGHSLQTSACLRQGFENNSRCARPRSGSTKVSPLLTPITSPSLPCRPCLLTSLTVYHAVYLIALVTVTVACGCMTSISMTTVGTHTFNDRSLYPYPIRCRYDYQTHLPCPRSVALTHSPRAGM